MRRTLLAMFLLALGLSRGWAGEPVDVDFFEKKVRPVLHEHCLACHGPQKQRGGLRLDSAAGLTKGGDRGPTFVPGNADKSLILHAIRYVDNDLRMPPKGKLSEVQVNDLTTWVAGGAPLPKESANATTAASAFNLEERRQHWCYQPVRDVAVPNPKDPGWVRSPIDAFIRHGLEKAGLQPAPPADPATWLRRVTFDLVGLPPTPGELQGFLADRSPKARETVVERLLASPRYGERWGRHWLDLVRYAETLGHEFDFDLPNAWKYRDYVIRAFNDDLPYDRFVREHVAGDLVPDPRLNSQDGTNVSILGTGFWWFGEAKHSPVDVRLEQANRVDNQVDVFSKTFLGQTIACARCHDHKFDALSTRDYYALYGYLKSSRYQQAFLDPPARQVGQRDQWRVLHDRLRANVAGRLRKVVEGMPDWLQAARTQDDKRGQLLRTALAGDEVKQPGHPLHAWHALASKPETDFAVQRQAVLSATMPVAADFEPLAGFGDAGFADWFESGIAFGGRPTQDGDVVLDERPGGVRVRFLPGGQAHSGVLAMPLAGNLRSPSFTIGRRFLHVLAAGRGTRMNVVLEGFTLICDPIYGGTTVDLNDDQLHWRTIDLGAWSGRRAYVELLDDPLHHPAMKALPAEAQGGAYLQMAAIGASDQARPPNLAVPTLGQRLLAMPSVGSLGSLATAYGEALVAALGDWERGVSGHADVVPLVNWLLDRGLLQVDVDQELLDERRHAIQRLRSAPRGLAIADGTGEDERVMLRGNPATLGEVAPRGLPVVLPGQLPSPRRGSGRLELADGLVDPANPLVARVLVNRLWQHHFGRGLVPTPDDFGRMGLPPTDPELLDWLATTFVRRGWSIKQMHRLLVLSNAYAMGSRPNNQAMQVDPLNQRWHHVPVRRLEAETIRDAMLTVSGRLDPTSFGPSVAPHLTPFMEGRGRPGGSGPLDGNGRRSVYLGVRRNFLSPMFLAFDYPAPSTTIGRRTSSNVPAQALTLLNDPFVLQQARVWAERTLADRHPDADARIASLYLTAFARPPTPEEQRDAQAFLADQAKLHGKSRDDPQVWADLCHVLFNVKEFVFVG